jgi:ribonuclease P protein component
LRCSTRITATADAIPVGGGSETLGDRDPEEFRDDERLRKSERLRDREEFLAVRGDGNRASNERCVVYARPNGRPHSRLGITASTDVGPATVRNWWKRRIREVFRRNKTDYPTGFDYVVIVRPSAETGAFSEIADALIELFGDAATRNDA